MRLSRRGDSIMMTNGERRVRRTLQQAVSSRPIPRIGGRPDNCSDGVEFGVQTQRVAIWRIAFIVLSGIVAFLVGGLLAGIALLVAIVQVALWRRDARLVQFLPPALGATAAAFLAGLWLVLAAEFRWVDGEYLDNLSPVVFVASLWWMFHNRMGSARNRREAQRSASTKR